MDQRELVEIQQQSVMVIERQLKVIQQLSVEIESLKQKAEAIDILEGTGAAIDMRTAANIIGDALSIDLGTVRLYRMLRSMGIVLPDINQAKQEYVSAGYLKNLSPVRGSHLCPCIKVTPKGVQWLIKRLDTWIKTSGEPIAYLAQIKRTQE